MTVAQDGRTIADGAHFLEAVRDEEHGSAALPPLAHHQKDAFRQVGRQGRGDLIQHEELRVAGQRPRQIQHPQHGQRQIADDLAEVDACRDPWFGAI